MRMIQKGRSTLSISGLNVFSATADCVRYDTSRAALRISLSGCTTYCAQKKLVVIAPSNAQDVQCVKKAAGSKYQNLWTSLEGAIGSTGEISVAHPMTNIKIWKSPNVKNNGAANLVTSNETYLNISSGVFNFNGNAANVDGCMCQPEAGNYCPVGQGAPQAIIRCMCVCVCVCVKMTSSIGSTLQPWTAVSALWAIISRVLSVIQWRVNLWT